MQRNRERIDIHIMQPIFNGDDGKEIRRRLCDDIEQHHNNIIIFDDKNRCRKENKKEREMIRSGDCFALYQRLQWRPPNKSSSKLILRFVFVFTVFLSVERRPYPSDNAIRKKSSSPTMVLSLLIPAMSRTRSKETLSLLRSSGLATDSITRSHLGDQFRLYSDLDDFFEGGDMERMVEELSELQSPRNKTANTNNGIPITPSRNCWREGLELSLEEKRNDEISSPSPVEMRTIRGRRIYVKHDDQLRLSGSGISGNKARKMWTLNEIPAKDFPSCLVSYGGPQSNSMLALAAVANYKNRELLSPKARAMKQNEILPGGDDETVDGDSSKNAKLPIRFVYYAKKLPRFLRKQPNGNFFRALSLGMELVELSREEYRDLFEHRLDDFEGAGRPPMRLEAPCPNSLWIPQGGAFASAQVGAQRLAQEIYAFWLEKGNDLPLTICVPGGTCSTALLLHHGLKQLLYRSNADGDGGGGGGGCDELNNYNDEDHTYSSFSRPRSIMDIEVVVVPCVGDASYARRQMMSLSAQIGASPEDIPTILQPEPVGGQSETTSSKAMTSDLNNLRRNKYFSFGKPNKNILETFQELQDECNLVVDLIYGAPSFAIMWRHWGMEMDEEESPPSLSLDLSFDPNQPLAGREIMYVHSGGLEGINSQLLRYKYDGLVEIKDVQLPGRRKSSKQKKK